MRILDDDAIVDELLNIKNCNFVASPITPWHANGIEACIEFFRHKEISLSGKVFLCKHEFTGKCITADNFYCDYENLVFEEVEFAKKSWTKKLVSFLSAFKNILFENRKCKEYFYVFNTSYPDFNWINIIRRACPNKCVVFVVVDEGAGSYFSTVEAWVSMHSDGNKKGLLRILKQIGLYVLGYLRIFPRKILTFYFQKKGRYYDNRMLIENYDGKLIPNESIVEYYSYIFSICRNKKLKKKEPIYKNKILVNTQCLVESGLVENDQDLQIYDEVFNVASELDVPVVMKHHPREMDTKRYDKYVCSIDERKNLSQEVLVNQEDKPLAIIGLYTSSLITIRTIYEVPAISLAKIFLTYNICDNLRRLLITFIDTYEGIVSFPSNHDELYNVLEKAVNQL